MDKRYSTWRLWICVRAKSSFLQTYSSSQTDFLPISTSRVTSKECMLLTNKKAQKECLSHTELLLMDAKNEHNWAYKSGCSVEMGIAVRGIDLPELTHIGGHCSLQPLFKVNGAPHSLYTCTTRVKEGKERFWSQITRHFGFTSILILLRKRSGEFGFSMRLQCLAILSLVFTLSLALPLDKKGSVKKNLAEQIDADNDKETVLVSDSGVVAEKGGDTVEKGDSNDDSVKDEEEDSSVVAKKGVEESDHNDSDIVAKKGVDEDDDSDIVAKKGVDEESGDNLDKDVSAIVPQKGVEDVNNKDSSVVAKKGVDSSEEDADTVAKKGVEDDKDSDIVAKKGVEDDKDSDIVAKKGVEDETKSSDVVAKKGVEESTKSKVVPKKGVYMEDSSTVAKKGVDTFPRKSAESSGTVAKKGLETGSWSHDSHTSSVVAKKGLDHYSTHEDNEHLNTIVTNLETVQSSTTSTTTIRSNKRDYSSEVTPSTSFLFGLVFLLTLMSTLLFLGFRQLDAIRRRRNYRRMNDFLIDGMYNDM